METNRIIVGMTGASGAVYGIRLLIQLRALAVESHLVLTESARRTIELETDCRVAEVEALADRAYDVNDIAAPIASGSFLSAGMAVIPCTVKTLSGIVHTYPENLLLRAADVVLKEKRKLVLVVRETPLHRGHLKLLTKADRLGAHLLPPIPSFYSKPQTIDDLVDQTVGRVLDYFGLPHAIGPRWGENRPAVGDHAATK